MLRSVATGLLCLFLGLPALAAQRVVSLAPSLSEIMLELDASDRLVGVLDGGERPAALARVPSVGHLGQLNMERLLASKPDLVLLWPGSLPAAQRAQLEELGIPLLVVEPHDLQQLAESFALIGARVGHAEQGEDLRQRFEQGMARLRERYARARPLRVFYQVWHQPLYTIGGGQIISRALEVCGARNLFAALTLPAPQVSVEAVLAADPEVILAGSGAELEPWQAWPQLSAVRLKQLLAVPDKGLERPSFQMLKATERLCERLSEARPAD